MQNYFDENVQLKERLVEDHCTNHDGVDYCYSFMLRAEYDSLGHQVRNITTSLTPTIDSEGDEIQTKYLDIDVLYAIKMSILEFVSDEERVMIELGII